VNIGTQATPIDFQLAHFVLSQQSADQRDDSKIISRFFTLGHQEFALDLAEKYKVNPPFPLSSLLKQNMHFRTSLS